MVLLVSKTTIWQLSISRDGMLKNLLKNLMNLIFQISVMPNAETRFEGPRLFGRFPKNHPFWYVITPLLQKQAIS